MHNRLEIIKWFFVIATMMFALIGNYYYHDIFLPLRILIVVILIGISGGITLTTNKGKKILIFAREAKAEIRKVIWPSRQETIYTTLVVIAVTSVMSIILWGLDGILIHLVSFITSLRF